MINYRRYYPSSLTPFLRSPKVKAYGMLILSLFALSIFGAFAIRPTLKTIVQLRRQITDSRLVEKKLEEKINTLYQVQPEYEMIKNDLPIISAALPSNPQFLPFLKNLNKFASESGVLISSLTFQPVSLSNKETSKISSFPFRLSLSGSFSNLTGFLTLLGKSERLITIENIEIKPTTSENRENLTLILNASLYSLTPKEIDYEK